jgi:hypothetical protein
VNAISFEGFLRFLERVEHLHVLYAVGVYHIADDSQILDLSGKENVVRQWGFSFHYKALGGKILAKIT